MESQPANMHNNRFRKCSFIIACTVIAVIAILVVGARNAHVILHKQDVKQMYGGDRGLDVVRFPDRVEVYRLGALPENIKRRAEKSDYPIAAGPIIASQDEWQRLSKYLLSTGSYGWAYAKGCIPVYGVKLSVFKGQDRVDIWLCFECDILSIDFNYEPTGGEDFDSIRANLVDFVRNAFPLDQDIQSLRR